jgi:hypothetical protein
MSSLAAVRLSRLYTGSFAGEYRHLAGWFANLKPPAYLLSGVVLL